MIIYTDASHLNGGKVSTWAASFHVPEGIPPVTTGGLLIGCNDSTEAEIMACICALKRVERGSTIILHTDCLPIVEFIDGKAKRIFRTLLRDLISETERHASVTFRWVKGHHADQHNKQVDQIARDLLRRAM